jgi:hypothetical protein
MSRMHILSFINLPGMTDIFRLLDETLARVKISLIVGPRGSGKTQILKAWLDRKDSPLRWYEAVVVEMDDPKILGEPAVSTVFSALYNELVTRLPRRRGRRQLDPIPPNEDVYNKKKLARLFRNVRSMMKTCKIRVIIIDNAHYLDKDALKLLVALYGHLGECTLILCAERLDDKKPETVLGEVYEGIHLFEEAHLHTIGLERLELNTFKKELMPRLLGRFNLRATFAPTLAPKIDAIYDDLFTQTNGSWHRIDTMAEECDASIKRRGLRGENGIAIITQEVIDDVLARLQGKKVVQFKAPEPTPASS